MSEKEDLTPEATEPLDSLDVAELEEQDLEDVAGGETTINNGCNIGCSID